MVCKYLQYSQVMLIITTASMGYMESVQLQGKIDSRLEMLLNLFEKEVEPYDRMSSLFVLLTLVGVILSTLTPVPIMLYVFHVNPFAALVSGGIHFWIIGGIVTTLVVTRIAILFFDHRKHQISKTEIQTTNRSVYVRSESAAFTFE